MSLALKRVRRTEVRKGMVLVHKTETPPKGKSAPPLYPLIIGHADWRCAAVRQFEGQVLIL